MQNTKPISTPLTNYFQLSKKQSSTTKTERAHIDKTQYVSIVSNLIMQWYAPN